MELEIESLVDASQEANSVLRQMLKPSDRTPIGTVLKKQFCSYSDGFAISPAVITIPPNETARRIAGVFSDASDKQPVHFFANRSTDPLNHFTLGNAQENAEILGQENAEWQFFGFRAKGKIHANIPASEIDSNVFHYELFQIARSSLRLGEFQREPFFKGAELESGSILFDIFFGAATLAGGMAAYPKVKQGFQEALLDYRKLKRWFDRALEKERVFKFQNPRKKK